ncbi:MAG: DNA gyrase subunit A [Lachnospiraceae bacterium]|nr:DNA gyrase subunit A [Lachnospiraceae bacterium]
MEANVYDKIHEVELKQTMEQSYVDYAMSVITSRAIPDVRDGLKPVQRRVLFSMSELSNTPDKPHRKCARIVGDTMGKYHPHGDSSIYGALVYMAQSWNTRYPLIDGHGNFGSVDGDGAAAMRYTEARLSKISMELLADLNKDTVDFVPNFDETEKEPSVLPSRIPNLLVNGAQGIAVGMATNIPPHNLREIVDAVVKIIDNRVNEGRETNVEEIMQIVKGPDFPTGAVILGKKGIEQAYRTGRGKLRIRSVCHIEPMENGKNRIIVTEIPYLVNKARLIEKIAELHKDKKIDGLTDINDESSSREGTGTRIVIELRRDVNPNVILNQLLRHTQLEDTYGVIMLALVNGEPKVLNILDMLKHYIRHQEDVVTRRTRFDLANAEKRAHIIEGLLIALDNIDEVIRLIRAAANVQEAKDSLINAFGLTDAQAQAIVDMRLRALTGLERSRLEEEYAQLKKTIEELRAILADENKLLLVIRDELYAAGQKYGDDRRTRIEADEDEIEDEDLIPEEDAVVAMTKLGYIKRMSLDNFKAQNRGGRGIRGMQVIDDDYTTELQMTGTHDNIMFFTNQGRIYIMKVYEIPESGRTSRGTPVINLIALQPEERVTAMVTQKELNTDCNIIMATRNGTIKKTPASEYRNIRKTGLLAITLKEGDELISVKESTADDDVLLVTKLGTTICFAETDARICGRTSIGVRGIRLSEGDELVSMEISAPGKTVLFVSENGMGKRTEFSDFNHQSRGGKGARGYRVTEKTGAIVGTESVSEDEEIMIITTEGIVIRTPVESIPVLGKTTSGVKLINIQKESEARVASFTVISASEEDTENPDGEGEEARESTGEEEND